MLTSVDKQLSRSRWLRSFLRSLLPFAFLLINGCGTGQPSVGAAREALRSNIDKGSEARLRITAFTKTDGRAMEVMGIKGHEMMFDSQAEFVSDAMFSIGMPLISEGSEITTSEYRAPSRGFSWNDFLAGSRGFRPAKKGDRLRLTGRVSFEQRESGWVPDGVRFTFVHDSVSAGTTELGPSSSAVSTHAQLQQNPEAEAERREQLRVARERRLAELTELIGQSKQSKVSVFSTFTVKGGVRSNVSRTTPATVHDAGLAYEDWVIPGNRFRWFGCVGDIRASTASDTWSPEVTIFQNSLADCGGGSTIKLFFVTEQLQQEFLAALSAANEAWWKQYGEAWREASELGIRAYR